MWIQQMFVAVLCVLVTLHRTGAVVNSGQASSGSQTASAAATSAVEDTSSFGGENQEATGDIIADSVASATSDQEANRRDAPLLTLGDSYGPPPPIVPHETYGPPDTYIPSGPSNPGLPVPVYGAPDNGNHVVYPGPPPDDLPPPHGLHGSFGGGGGGGGGPQDTYGPPHDLSFNLPKDNYGPPPHNHFGPPKEHYGPPKDSYGPPLDNYGPPKDNYGPPPPLKYGPPRPLKHLPPLHKPKHHYGPPRPQYGPPSKHFGPGSGPKLPRPQYGPPFKSFHGGAPKPIYGPPKHSYGPPKSHGPPPFYGPPPGDNYGPPKHHHGPPKDVYGPPIAQHYGPPEPIAHGPPHPGAPAPPTPPDIKYDGWQPIPGLVSRPLPSDTYGVPHGQSHSLADLQFNGDFVPPPADHGHGHEHGRGQGQGQGQGQVQGHGHSHGHHGHGVQSLSLGSSYGSSAGISDSYGAPLNTVTGSGGIVSTSGDAHINNQDQSTITLGLTAAGIGGGGHDNSLSVIKSIGYEIFQNGNDGGGGGGQYNGNLDNYVAPQGPSSYSNDGSYAVSSQSFKSFGKELSLSSNGIGLIPPSGFYGAVPSGHYGTPLLSPPSAPKQRPLVFRDNLIDNHVSHGPDIQENSHGFSGGQFSDIGGGGGAPSLTNFYTLPNTNNPVSFQNVVHGSNVNYETSFGNAQALTSYNVPLSTVDGSYGVPNGGGIGIGLDQSIPTQTIDLTNVNLASAYVLPQFGGGGQVPHDCSLHKSQSLPQLNYGLPSGNSYTASLQSLNTNIGGGGGQLSSNNYGMIDLQAAHSQSTSSLSNDALSNEITDETSKEQYGKSLAENFAPGSELIKSQSIDFNNIPVQGSLGSYTLQIQSADGLGGTAQSMHVPHDQVLNDGLLQSILAAIEQPQQKNAHILGQPLLQVVQQPIQNGPVTFEAKQADGEAQNSQNSVVVVAPAASPESNTAATTDTETPQDKDDEDTTESLQLIDNNEIALYFSNNGQKINGDGAKTEEKATVVAADANGQVWNGQQYGSYVSFKTPDTSYVYGDVKTAENATPVQKQQ